VGTGFALIFWVVVGTTLALLCSFILLVLTWAFVHGRPHGKRIAAQAAALPFVSLVWFGIAFFAMSLANDILYGRDMGIGDAYYCPLPNGYRLSMIDVTNQGAVMDDRYPLSSGHRVRSIQISDGHIWGAAPDAQASSLNSKSDPTDSYFEIDTISRSLRHFASLDEMKLAASASGITLNLEPVYDFYTRGHPTRFYHIAFTLSLLPPVGGLLFLAYRIREAYRG
jgi:hypothetical protein